MKYSFILLFFALVACGSKTEKATPEAAADPVAMGKEIFEGRGNCFACHKTDQKVIGPSVKEIAAIYKEKNGNMIAFLRGEAPPIVDPSQYESMKVNLELTKVMSEAELKALEAYFYSVK